MKSDPNLRFAVGDRVFANIGKWAPGTIVKLHYRGPHWGKEKKPAPYQIKLDQGHLIFAPQDNDRFVKPLKPKTPVTVLTGFLGAGKTTLLNHILTEMHGKKIGIIENEFGAVSIDDKLLKENQKRSSEEVIIEMKNGCVCCTVRGDLTTALQDIFKGDRKLDAIIIETTGLADPAPVIQTFCLDDFASTYLELDAVITVVDAKHIIQHLDDQPKDSERESNEAISQVAFADRILLNKMDLVDEKEVKKVNRRIRAINKGADIMPCTLNAKLTVDLDKILGIKAFDLESILKDQPKFLAEDAESDSDCLEDCEDPDHQHEEDGHGHAHGDGAEDKHEEGKDDKEKPKRKKHRHKHKYNHNPHVNSIVLQYPGDVDIKKLNLWIQNILTKYSKDIFRMKGILAVHGSPTKFVFNGVHMFFNASPSVPWKKDEKRESVLVFIGRKMKDMEADLRKDFENIRVAGSY